MLKIELFSINDINNKTKKLKTKTKNGSQFALNGTRSCYQQAALVAPILLH
jgi:hypothetical protein